MASCVKFTIEDDFLGLFIRVRIEVYFPLKCQLFNFLKFSFNLFAVTVTSLTAASIEVSSAKNFRFDVMSLDKSLM